MFDANKTQVLLTEGVKNSYKRKFKCPYCEVRLEKEKLVNHIDNHHEDMIPKDFTAARIVFNMANNKDRQLCVCGCGRETAWREDVWRYDRYATDKCREKYSKEMKQRMVRVYGKEHLMNEPDYQEKMLSGRSISGEYTFTTGGRVSYVGSYERKLLEFLDKVMGYRARDIDSPGPVVEYEFEGKKHLWITDQYLAPYNLVFDCKDGGDNPNRREMDSYRAKQIAKEKAIIDQGKYNYIRLTNNEFSQLFLLLADLKEQMLNNPDSEEKLIRIYEHMGGAGGPAGGALVDMSSEEYNTKLIVPYLKKNTFNKDIAIAKNKDLEEVYVMDENGEVIELDKDTFLENCVNYALFECSYPFFTRKCDDKPTNLFELATGKKLLQYEQIFYDPDFKRVPTNEEVNKIMDECIVATLRGSKYKVPIYEDRFINNEYIQPYHDEDGIFIENILTGLRSKSFSNIQAINDNIADFVTKGEMFG